MIHLDTIFDKLGGIANKTTHGIIIFIYQEYGDIDDMDIKNIYAMMMTLYNLEKPFTTIINQIKNGRTFTLEVEQAISEDMIISKGFTLLANTALFHQDIQEL